MTRFVGARRALLGGYHPVLQWNFVAGGLPGWISNARTSQATYFDAAGSLQTAAANVARLDHDYATLATLGLLVEAQSLNLFPNSFMAGEVDGAQPPPAYQFFPTANGTAVQSGSGTELGIPYVEMHWSGTGSADPTKRFDDLGNGAYESVAFGETFTFSSFEKVVSDSGTTLNSINIGEYTNGSPHVFLAADGASFTNGQAASLTRFSHTRVLNQPTVGYLDCNHQINTLNGVAYDQKRRIAGPQLEHSAFVSSLIQSKNILISPQYPTGEWNAFLATQTGNAATAPDGASTATLLAEDNTSGFHRNRQTVAKAAAIKNYVYYVWLKASGRNVDIAFTNAGASASADIYFNLANNTIIGGPFNSGFTIGTCTIVAAANGYSLITIPVTTDNSSSLLVELRLNNGTGTNPNYAGNGVSGIYWWNPTLQEGTSVTVPAQLDDRKRTADAITLTGAPLVAATAGPSIVEYQSQATLAISRVAYAAGAIAFPASSWIRSLAIYPRGTPSAYLNGKLVAGSPY